MEYFRMFQNGVWHYEYATDPTVQWAVENFRELFIAAFIGIPLFSLLFIIFAWQEWKIRKENRVLEIHYVVVEVTRDFSVYDMTDEELEDYYDAEMDF
jgi:hypothetical protein